MGEPKNIRQSGERIEQALSELEQSADARTLNLAEEVLRLVSDLYGAGLARILEISGEAAPELVEELAADDLVASLLVVHGLHPDSLEYRTEAALASVRPFLAQHGGDVELVAVDDELGAVKLRLLGSCDGCPASAATLRGAVEVAIAEKAPEVRHVVVEEHGHGGADEDAANEKGANENGENGPVPANQAVPITLGVKRVYEECPAEVSEVSVR